VKKVYLAVTSLLVTEIFTVVASSWRSKFMNILWWEWERTALLLHVS